MDEIIIEDDWLNDDVFKAGNQAPHQPLRNELETNPPTPVNQAHLQTTPYISPTKPASSKHNVTTPKSTLGLRPSTLRIKKPFKPPTPAPHINMMAVDVDDDIEDFSQQNNHETHGGSSSNAALVDSDSANLNSKKCDDVTFNTSVNRDTNSQNMDVASKDEADRRYSTSPMGHPQVQDGTIKTPSSTTHTPHSKPSAASIERRLRKDQVKASLASLPRVGVHSSPKPSNDDYMNVQQQHASPTPAPKSYKRVIADEDDIQFTAYELKETKQTSVASSRSGSKASSVGRRQSPQQQLQQSQESNKRREVVRPVIKRVRFDDHVQANEFEAPDVEDEEDIGDDDATKTDGLGLSESEMENDDEDQRIVMAISSRGRKVGCAFFDDRTHQLYVMEDVEEDEAFTMTTLLKLQVNPSVILMSSRTEEAFYDVVRDGTHETIFRPGPDFAIKTARNRLLSLRALASPSRHLISGMSTKRAEMALYLESVLDTVCENMISSAGALIAWLSQGGMREGDDEMSDFSVEKIEQFKLNNFMRLNTDAFSSLGIFSEELHPSMRSRRSREGLSLFDIMDTTRTAVGRALLKTWFLRPSLDLHILEERQEAIAYFVRPDLYHISDTFKSCLKQINNIPRVIHRMKSRLSLKEWESVVKFSLSSIKIKRLVLECGVRAIPVFERVGEAINESDLKESGRFVTNVIDFDESPGEGHVSVKQGIDEALDEMKRTYAGMGHLLTQAVVRVAATIPTEFATSLNVVYFPQLGFLTTIPKRPEMQQPDDFLIEGLEFQFSTANTVFYKSEEMFGLDETLGDVHSNIVGRKVIDKNRLAILLIAAVSAVDRENEIIQQLQESALGFSEAMLRASSALAELDWQGLSFALIAMSDAARRYNYKRPTMTEENRLDIVRGRHPLQELCVDAFVPNSTHLCSPGQGTRCVLLTGANFSGKSIHLKQIALITYMAHIGSFVPADDAIVGLTDRIMTRIQTRESVSKIQSAFLIDLQQVALMIRYATARSLLIIDEFGKGTVSKDGVGLFCSALDSFMAKRDLCPKVVAATHFHEIFAHQLLESLDDPILFTCAMEIIEADAKRAPGVTFLYRVIPGQASKSLGAHCARLAGIPDHVVERGIRASSLLAEGGALVDLPPRDMGKERAEARDKAVNDLSDVASKFDCLQGDLSELFEQVDFVSDLL
ncbi:hypothetical protein SmJEL517_g00294 [Synchytrium microbalum]|uniref:DNA mismatch repair protein MSH5 n=1 Tax=Synchytrium microbalum TaxID=1806994 RepID=A0A507C8Z6_9FUNG|nr:uncharacterized protein SmJEL517_g00294 [Synchytrium microbalum]TPX38060.1 hypothetical protein SmJEL517_g00294 [Synchytrium microbalum]